MVRPKVKADDDTVRVCVQIAAADRERLREAAAKFGKPMPEFVRLVLLAAASGATQTPAPRPARKVSPAPGSGNTLAHTHRAGAMLSGGIYPCIEKGCAARKIHGTWLEVS